MVSENGYKFKREIPENVGILAIEVYVPKMVCVFRPLFFAGGGEGG
jgi:hypothetical protein